MPLSPEQLGRISAVVNVKKIRNKRVDCFVSDERIQRVVDLYEGGMSLRGLIPATGMEYYRAVKILEMSGVRIRSKAEQIKHIFSTTDATVRSGLNRRLLSPEQIATMISMHQDSGLRSAEIATVLGVSESGILSMLKREKSYVPMPHHFYTLDESYFDEIDTPEKAYYFGLLMADGCVSMGRNNKSPRFCISLVEGDKHILEDFRDAIGSNKPLAISHKKDKNAQTQAVLAIHSPRIYDGLVKNGCVERKTYHAEYPGHLADNLHSHFIRGYFDGDGCINIYQRHTKNNVRHDASFHLVGTKSLLFGIQSQLVNSLGFRTGLIREVPGCFTLSYAGNQQMVVLHSFLYGSGGPSLSRKRAKFAMAMQLIRDHVHGNNLKYAPVDTGTVVSLYTEKKLSGPQIAHRLGSSVYLVMKALKTAGVKREWRHRAVS